MSPRLIEMLAKYVSIRTDAEQRNRVLTGELMKAIQPDQVVVIRASLRSVGGLIHDCSAEGKWPENALPSWADRVNSPGEAMDDALAEFTKKQLAGEPHGVTVTLAQATAGAAWERRYEASWDRHPFKTAGVAFRDYLGGAFVSARTQIVTAFALYRDGPKFSEREVEQLRYLVNCMSHFDRERLLGPLDRFRPLPAGLRPLLKLLLSSAPDERLRHQLNEPRLLTREGFRKRAEKVLEHYGVENRNALKALFLDDPNIG